MQCSYDYITHLTTLSIVEAEGDTSIVEYSYIHSISPTGGEEMSIFDADDTSGREGVGRLKFISEKLFYWPGNYVTSLVFLDFERATFKALQAPAALLEQADDAIIAPLVVWDCRRID